MMAPGPSVPTLPTMTRLILPPSMTDPQERAAARLERVTGSPQRVAGKFRNPSGLGPMDQAPPWDVMRDFVVGRGRRRPPSPLPALDPLPRWREAPSTGLRATWLGHSTVLLELDGARILTDPVWAQRAAPTEWAGPLRFHPVPVEIDALPPLDAVLVSHDHYDHLDASAVRRLAGRPGPVFVTALGVGARLEKMGVPGSRVVELDWWEGHPIAGTSVTIVAAPAQHFSGRTPFDRNETLWASYAFLGPRHRVYFSGDTGLEPSFAEIGRQLGPFDLVMLEVGAFHPAWGNIHLGPVGAMEAYARLGGAAFLPVHWGTFDLAVHPWDEPIRVLAEAEADGALVMVAPKLGEALDLDSQRRPQRPQAWWAGLS